MNRTVKNKLTTDVRDDRETTDRLLDTAERLFGELGYDGVGMRALAEQAKVNLGAATYHFGTKEALYIETFMRRFRPTNAERLRLLRQAEAQAPDQVPTVEAIVECMVRPPYQLGLMHPNFHALMARNLMMPPPFFHAAIHKEMEPNVEQFIAAFRRSLRKMPENLIRLRTMFAMGALLMFSMRFAKVNPVRNPKSEEGVLKELIRFISTGLQSEPTNLEIGRLPMPGPRKKSLA